VSAVTRHDFELFADYFQFYLQDDLEGIGDLSDAWTQEALDRLLAVAIGTVGVGTVRNMTVPVAVELHRSEPESDIQSWDHVTECDVELRSGRLVVAGCTDYFPGAARIPVPPGLYRVRTSYGDLNSLSSDGLDGQDHYRVQLWQTSELGGVRVLRRRDQSST
jgi:hypothetical protein